MVRLIPLLVVMLLILAACASQAPCIDGYHLPAEDGWIKESEGSRTTYRKVTYARWVCTERYEGEP